MPVLSQRISLNHWGQTTQDIRPHEHPLRLRIHEENFKRNLHLVRLRRGGNSEMPQIRQEEVGNLPQQFSITRKKSFV